MVGWVSCTLLPAPTGGLNSTDVQLEILPTTNLPQDRERGGEWWHPSGGLSHDLTIHEKERLRHLHQLHQQYQDGEQRRLEAPGLQQHTAA